MFENTEFISNHGIQFLELKCWNPILSILKFVFEKFENPTPGFQKLNCQFGNQRNSS